MSAAVVITYTFDADTPLYIFDDEQKATSFLRGDYEEEKRIQQENGTAFTAKIEDDGRYAEITYPDGDKIEWFVTFPTDKRSKQNILRRASEAVESFLNDAPEENELDKEDVSELYDAAEKFLDAVKRLGYDF